MPSSLIQNRFNGGELAPGLYARVDIERRNSSLKTGRNMYVLKYGGIANRAGFEYKGGFKISTGNCRLIPFNFNDDETYIIEIGDTYMRFWQNGVQVESAPSVPLELTTPWDEADLPKLKYTQSADVIRFFHPSYQTQDVSRVSATSFTIADYDGEEGPFQDQNVDDSITIHATAGDQDAGTTSIAVVAAGGNPFTSDQVGTLIHLEQEGWGSGETRWQARESTMATGDKRFVDERLYKMTATSNGNDCGDTPPTNDVGITWDGPNSAIKGLASGTYGCEWEYRHSGYGILEVTAFTDDQNITCTAVTNIPLGVASVTPTYLWSFAAWDDTRGYPGCGAYYQQRLITAASIAQPQTIWCSETGIYNGYRIKNPTLSTDAFSFNMDSREVNEVRHLVPLKDLVVLTAGAVWIVDTVGDTGFAASTVKPSVQAYNGASHVTPIVIEETLLYVQARGQIIRDLTYSFEVDGFAGNDLTIFSYHLFKGKETVDWTYAQQPESLIWTVNDDGDMRTLTYVREQGMLAWTRHDTKLGEVKAIASVPEGNEDAVYIAVDRTINGSTTRYLERLHTRNFNGDIEDAFFVDSGLTYDGRNTGTTTFTLSGGTNWTTDETLTLTASASTFSVPSVGRYYRLRVDVLNDDGEVTGKSSVVVLVTAYTNATTVDVKPETIVPDDLQGVATDEWALMATTLSGLDHLEGEAVSILSNGDVHPEETVSGGSITLDQPSAIAHVGLAIEADLETLPISAIGPGGETIRDNKKSVVAIGFEVEESRGLFGARSKDSRPPEFHDLIELKQRTDEGWNESIRLLTGYARLPVPSRWDREGNVFVRQRDPLPLTILSIIPEVAFGGKS